MTVTPLTLPSPLPTLFSPDWSVAVSMETAFSTDVQEGRASGAETRRGLMDRPYRTLSVRLAGLSQYQAAEMWAFLRRNTGERLILPLYQDQSLTTSTSSGTTINCSTTRGRFFVGGRVAIYSRLPGGETTAAEYRIIQSLTASTITPTVALSSSHPAGSVVCPVLDIEVSLQGANSGLLTDQAGVVSFEAIEVSGGNTLPPITTGLPAGFSIHNGYPILNIQPNWLLSPDTAASHPGDSYGVGRGLVISTRTEHSREAMAMTLNGFDKQSAWNILTFFESRFGRLYPFWVSNPQTLFEANDYQTTHVDVQPLNEISVWQDLVTSIAIVEQDGSTQVRGVESIEVAGDFWRITFDTSITVPSSTARITAAHLVRMESDAHGESWATDGTVLVTAAFIELLDEADAVIVGVDPEPYTFGQVEALAPWMWLDASGNCWSMVNDSDPINEFTVPVARSIAWPIRSAGQTRVDFLFDVRQDGDDPSRIEPYLRRGGNSPRTPHLTYFLDNELNAGLPTLYYRGNFPTIATGNPEDDNSGFLLENSEGKFWDDTEGLTVLICGRFAGVATPLHEHLMRDGVFEWNCSGTSPVTNEKQLIELDNATDGTFRIEFDGFFSTPISPIFASLQAVREVIEAMPPFIGVGAVNVVVTSPTSLPGGPWTLEFVNELGGVDVPLITLDTTLLVADSTSVTVTQESSFGITGHVKFFAVADTEDADANISYPEPSDDVLRIMAVRWDPGVSAELWINGGVPYTATTPAASLDGDPRPTAVMKYSLNEFGSGSGLSQDIHKNDNINRYAMTNAFLIFRKALTDEELDAVAGMLSARYHVSWTPVNP